MPRILKSTVLAFGLAAGTALTAQAQSVSSLPPGGGPVPQTAITQPYSSSQSFYPKPGGSEVWKEEHYQPPSDYAVNKAAHPYSTSIGPAPGSHSSGKDEPYQPSTWDAAPAQHPYTANIGPKPN
jgi:hypothetical protein